MTGDECPVCFCKLDDQIVVTAPCKHFYGASYAWNSCRPRVVRCADVTSACTCLQPGNREVCLLAVHVDTAAARVSTLTAEPISVPMREERHINLCFPPPSPYRPVQIRYISELPGERIVDRFLTTPPYHRRYRHFFVAHIVRRQVMDPDWNEEVGVVDYDRPPCV